MLEKLMVCEMAERCGNGACPHLLRHQQSPLCESPCKYGSRCIEYHEPEPEDHNLRTFETGALADQIGGDHYRKMAIQPIEFCHRNNLGPCETLAIKYLCRHRAKNGAEDIKKAIHAMRLLLDLEYGAGRKERPGESASVASIVAQDFDELD